MFALRYIGLHQQRFCSGSTEFSWELFLVEPGIHQRSGGTWRTGDMVVKEGILAGRIHCLYSSANIYGLSVIMGFADGIMKVSETSDVFLQFSAVDF